LGWQNGKIQHFLTKIWTKYAFMEKKDILAAKSFDV